MKKGTIIEYPYATALEGGEINRARVSVQYVSISESGRQGSFIHNFYNKAPVGVNNSFLVIPLGGVSGYFDKRGLWNFFPK